MEFCQSWGSQTDRRRKTFLIRGLWSGADPVWNCYDYTTTISYGLCTEHYNLKLGIHLRQRQAEARRCSLSLASVDGASSRAACLRGCHDPSHRVLVHQGEASPRNSPPYVQYGRNVPRLAEMEKHSSVCGAAQHVEDTAPCLSLPASNVFPALQIINESKSDSFLSTRTEGHDQLMIPYGIGLRIMNEWKLS